MNGNLKTKQAKTCTPHHLSYQLCNNTNSQIKEAKPAYSEKLTAQETRKRAAGSGRNPNERVFLPWFENEANFKPVALVVCPRYSNHKKNVNNKVENQYQTKTKKQHNNNNNHPKKKFNLFIDY